MRANQNGKWMALGLLGFGLLLALQYLGLTLYSAGQMDDQAIEQSSSRVQAMLRRAQAVQVAVSEEYGWWDELIIALEEQDLPWLADEFDKSIEERYGVTQVIALDESYEPIFSLYEWVISENAQMLGWDLEVLRPMIEATQASSRSFPESASDVLRKDGVTYIVTAAALTHTRISAPGEEGEKRKTLLLMAPIESEYLGRQESDLQVRDLRWASTPDPEGSSLAVRSRQNKVQGYLVWYIQHPSGFLVSTITVWSIPVAILSVAFGFLLLRWFDALIAQSKQAEIRSVALEQSQVYFQSMSDDAPVLIWETDERGRLIYGNRLFYKLWSELKPGYSPEDMSAFYLNDGKTPAVTLFERLMRSDANVQQDCVLRFDGEEKRWLSMSCVVQRRDWAATDRFLFSATDVTDRKKTELLIWKQANFDALTGLANRSLFIDRLEQELASSLRSKAEGGIMFIDLDNFKSINDTLGHSAGDEVLKEISQRISQCLRSRDTVARFGGDEFVALLPDTAERSKVSEVAQRIRGALQDPFALGDLDASQHRGVLVTASIGVAYYPVDGQERDLLLNRADKAMYRAKMTGRDGIAYFHAPS